MLEGFLLFADPLRPDARATVNALRARGVSIRVITGDSRFVTAHVAQAIGLSPDHVVTGDQIAGLGADALARLVARAHVFAEIDPAGTERIVAAFRRAGHVTGFLGDGITDATALRLADIGLSVQGAADVARDAADMILTAPDLSVVLTGIDEGRRASANTRKYLRITTAASFGNMLSMAAASVVLPFLPLTAGQILLNNLLSDLPMPALAGDLVDAEERHRPHRWQSGELARFMAVFSLISSAFDLITFWLLLQVFDASPEEFRTAWFVESLMTELLFALSIRTAPPFWKSRPSPGVVGLSAAVAGLALALPWLPGASVMGFVPLPWDLVGWAGALLVIYLAVSEAAKAVWARMRP